MASFVAVAELAAAAELDAAEPDIAGPGAAAVLDAAATESDGGLVAGLAAEQVVEHAAEHAAERVAERVADPGSAVADFVCSVAAVAAGLGSAEAGEADEPGAVGPGDAEKTAVAASDDTAAYLEAASTCSEPAPGLWMETM